MQVQKKCQITEQVIEDPVSGLTFQFEKMPNGDTSMRVYGESLEFGNRTFEFNEDGTLIGRGTTTNGKCRPTWRVDLTAL